MSRRYTRARATQCCETLSRNQQVYLSLSLSLSLFLSLSLSLVVVYEPSILPHLALSRFFANCSRRAIRFCETCVHGALPWNATHDRRVLLIRYTPGYMSHGESRDLVQDVVYPSWFEELTTEQREVMRNPSLARRSTNYKVQHFGSIAAPRL